MKKLIYLFVVVCSLNANAAVIYDVQGGKLMGASGVMVNGTDYTVTFGDSCSSMYAGCTDNAVLDFHNQTDAVSALQALFDTVLVNNVIIGGTTYNFDSVPTLINSCDRTNFCEMWVPYLVSGASFTAAWWVNTNNTDYVGSNSWGPYSDVTYGNGRDYMAFTDWRVTQSVSGPTPTVPEPATLALMGLGFAGMGYLRRRQTQA